MWTGGPVAEAQSTCSAPVETGPGHPERRVSTVCTAAKKTMKEIF